MVKTRVHDLAAEFGVAPEQLLSMLKDMNIFVRSHLSALESDQVSAVRVRWEREKRKSAEEPTAKKGRRKAVKAEPAPVAVEAKPAKRRRTAAEVAVVEAQAQAEKAAEMAALELERPIVELEEPVPAQSLEERARALFKDLPPRAGASPRRRGRAAPRTPRAAAPAHGSGEPSPPRLGTHSAAAAPSRAPFIPPRIQRPAADRAARTRSRCSAAARRPRRRGPARPSRPGAPARPSRGAAPPAAPVRSRRRKGRRPQEGQEGQALVGGPGCGAGEHPEDAAGHEGARRPEGRAPLGRAVVPRRAGRPRWPRSASGRRPGSGSTSSSRSPSSPAP